MHWCWQQFLSLTARLLRWVSGVLLRVSNSFAMRSVRQVPPSSFCSPDFPPSTAEMDPGLLIGPQTSGPPAHWIQRVRQAAPSLLEGKVEPRVQPYPQHARVPDPAAPPKPVPALKQRAAGRLPAQAPPGSVAAPPNQRRPAPTPVNPPRQSAAPSNRPVPLFARRAKSSAQEVNTALEQENPDHSGRRPPDDPVWLAWSIKPQPILPSRSLSSVSKLARLVPTKDEGIGGATHPRASANSSASSTSAEPRASVVPAEITTVQDSRQLRPTHPANIGTKEEAGEAKAEERAFLASRLGQQTQTGDNEGYLWTDARRGNPRTQLENGPKQFGHGKREERGRMESNVAYDSPAMPTRHADPPRAVPRVAVEPPDFRMGQSGSSMINQPIQQTAQPLESGPWPELPTCERDELQDEWRERLWGQEREAKLVREQQGIPWNVSAF
jgi:hypothetical protein